MKNSTENQLFEKDMELYIYDKYFNDGLRSYCS